MKRKPWRLACLLAAVVVAVAVAPAATAQDNGLEDDIEASVVLGLDWLAPQQNQDGSFGGECDAVGRTGLVIFKKKYFQNIFWI